MKRNGKPTKKEPKLTNNNKKKLSNDELGEWEFGMNNKQEINISNIKIKNYIKFKNKKQKELYDKIINNRIVFVKGVAGTGKTLITLMAAIECLKNQELKINKILLSKPIVEASTNMGFLPGTVSEKIFQYFFSFYDNLKKIIGDSQTKFLKQSGIISESPLNFMRGNTFGSLDLEGNPIGTFCILDEAQNATVKDVKLFISRNGENSKLVIMGDTDQTDLKLRQGEETSLDDAFKRFQGIDGIAFVEFTEDEIVRDPFLIEIMKRYRQ